MAAQSDAPDDLISELARLMADDARSDKPGRTEPPAPFKPNVRIPGGEAPAAPTPRFDFSASTAAQSAPSIRIPGAEAKVEPTVEAKPASTAPFRFDFSPAGPSTPVPSAPAKPAEPEPAAEPPPELDQDSLADLIAAELANDMAPADEPPVPAAPGPAKGEDNFGVPPVFGLGAPTKPAVSTVTTVPAAPPVAPTSVQARVEPTVAAVETPAPAPVMPTVRPDPTPQAPASDPLSEIERLVGPAVNMSRAEPARAPSPALRSLATPTMPKAEPVAPQNTGPGSVDEAILAAAAATGARVEWVDPDEASLEPEPEVRAARAPRAPFRMSRAVAGPLVAVGLLGIAGFGLYWVLGQGGAPTGPAPVIVADTAPVKDVPAPVETEPQQSVVFNEISGAEPPADEQIVSRDQADVDAITEAAANTAAAAAATDAAASTDGISNVINGTDQAAIDPDQLGLVNRKVRTVTVRPDGTIVSSDDSMAGASILPVDRPAVPEVPGADTSTPDLLASTTDAATTATPAATEAEVPATPAVPTVEPGSVVPVIDSTGAAVAGRTVTIPMQRPADFAAAATSALAAAAVPATTPAATAPTATAAPATPGTSAAYVQLASQRSEEAARDTAQTLATRFGVLFGGANIEIQRVDLGERGIYYRVLVPTASRESGANICTQVQAAGGDCLLL